MSVVGRPVNRRDACTGCRERFDIIRHCSTDQLLFFRNRSNILFIRPV